MHEDLEKEKWAMAKMWAKRTNQIDRIVESTVGMYGDIHGISGGALPAIETLAPRLWLMGKLSRIEIARERSGEVNLRAMKMNKAHDASREIKA